MAALSWVCTMAALVFYLAACSSSHYTGQTPARRPVAKTVVKAKPNPGSTRSTAPQSWDLPAERAAVGRFLKRVKKTVAAALATNPDLAWRDGVGRKGDLWTLPPSWCAAQIGLPKNQPPEKCTLRELPAGRAAVMTLVHKCSDEHCRVDAYIMAGRAGLLQSTVDLETPLVVTPGSRYLLTGRTSLEPGGYQARLTRVDLATMEHQTLAPCAVPIVSPSGQWVVCRGVKGNVHRLPIKGGDLKLVHKIDLAGETIETSPHLGVTLTPVKFITDKRIRIVTVTQDGTKDVEEATWSD